MATMSHDEQQKLAHELVNLSFNGAKGRLRRLDPKNSMAFFRNSQSPTRLHTRYNLHTEGISVTLIEEMTEAPTGHGSTFKSVYKIAQVIIDPLE